MPRIDVVAGARAGLRFPLAGAPVLVGRGSECQLRLEPETDLQVSARHIELRPGALGWTVRDLGSRNGTYLNGTRVYGESPLIDGDCLTLGEDGPALVFRQDVTDAAPRRRALLARALPALALLLLVLGAAVLYAGRSARRGWSQERARMQSQIDSLQRAGQRTEQALRGQVSGLAEALQASQAEVEALRGEVARAAAARDASGTASLRTRLAAAAGKLRRQQAAAGLDFAGIERADRHAIAMIYVEYADGRIVTATAFAVRPDGTLVTNRHVVVGDDGARPKRIAIQFSDSEQVWPARVLGTAEGDDLALVAVERVLGTIPVVRGLNLRPDTLASGAPVALIGFPLGGDEPRVLPGGAHAVTPLLGAGILRRASPDRLELEGYGAQGASGTPILDGDGQVLGVLFGGAHANGEQQLYAVPSAALSRLLASIHR